MALPESGAPPAPLAHMPMPITLANKVDRETDIGMRHTSENLLVLGQ